MTVKVTVPLNSGVSATVSTGNSINTSIVSKKVSTDLENLGDVDTQNAQDGYTLVYNDISKKWEASNMADVVAVPTVISGGTY